MSFGTRLRKLRREQGMDLLAFAEKLGISRSSLIRYEKDERSPDSELLLRLYHVFGADPTLLITGHYQHQLTIDTETDDNEEVMRSVRANRETPPTRSEERLRDLIILTGPCNGTLQGLERITNVFLKRSYWEKIGAPSQDKLMLCRMRDDIFEPTFEQNCYMLFAVGDRLNLDSGWFLIDLGGENLFLRHAIRQFRGYLVHSPTPEGTASVPEEIDPKTFAKSVRARLIDRALREDQELERPAKSL